MINLIASSVIEAFSTPDGGAKVEFIRNDKMSKELRPFFNIKVNDELTDIGFNSDIFDKATPEATGTLVAKIISVLTSRIQTHLASVKI